MPEVPKNVPVVELDTIRASDAPGPGSSPGGHTKKRLRETSRGRFSVRRSWGEKPSGSENRLAIFFREAKPRQAHQHLAKSYALYA